MDEPRDPRDIMKDIRTFTRGPYGEDRDRIQQWAMLAVELDRAMEYHGFVLYQP